LVLITAQTCKGRNVEKDLKIL